MTSLPLVLESEWSHYDDAVDYDFKKLLLARAAHKVMIFQGRDTERHYARLSQFVAKSAITPAGDRYLFLFWHWDEQKLNWRLFVKPQKAQEAQLTTESEAA